MKQRELGTSGIEVSAIGLGCMGFSGSYGPVDEQECVATVRRALDLGVTLFDTADFYGPGTSERLLGRALAGRRDEAVIASKTGMRRTDEGRMWVDGSPEYLTSAIDGTLERLGVDHLDLYYLARVSPEVTIEESVGALGALVAAGKVRAIGLCEASADTLRKANGVHPISALQTEYSLWERHVEERILPACVELEITLVPYRPLGSGFLTGAIASPADLPEGDFRRADPRFSPENWEQNDRIGRAVRELARTKDATPSQIAIAWVLAQGETTESIVPIPGCKRRTHLVDNVAAAEVMLSTADLAALDAAASMGTAGDRFPAPLLALVDRD
ncbi:aldo/keto reductase [Actinokineospora enzanensis]|uniref:aldo/keto reductase n=1 Tax=Actinokineospora enzanensis TaxID=155975 RepID=UPI00036C7A28|nr:aldo/keto reductase [Actinokineospora enzanensis]